MAGKVFRLVFITALLTLNTVVYYLIYAPNAPKHLEYIPGDAMMVFTVNTKEISGKLAYTALFEQEEFTELLKTESETEVDWSEKLNNGLQFYGKISLFFIQAQGTGLESGMLLDVRSESKLKAFLTKDGASLDDLGDGIFCTVEGGDEPDAKSLTSVAFNHDVAVLLSGSANSETKKQISKDILLKKNPAGDEYSPVNQDGHDFAMVLKPGIEKMDDAPALKGIIGSFIYALTFSGNFNSESVDLEYKLTTDPALLADAGTVFKKHDHIDSIPEELRQGIFNMHLTFDSGKWVEWMEKGNLLNAPDSVKVQLYAGLRNSIGEHFALLVDSVQVKRIAVDSTGKKMKTYVVPDFMASFSMKDSVAVSTLFENMAKDSMLVKNGNTYSYSSPHAMVYQFRFNQNVLMMSSSGRFMEHPEKMLYGYSNWFFFSLHNFIQSMPLESPFGFSIAGVIEEICSINMGYGYSTGTEKNNLNWVGKFYYNDRKKHSLIETIKFMQNAAGMFLMTEFEEDPENNTEPE